jgi:hypothetical protein
VSLAVEELPVADQLANEVLANDVGDGKLCSLSKRLARAGSFKPGGGRGGEDGGEKETDGEACGDTSSPAEVHTPGGGGRFSGGAKAARPGGGMLQGTAASCFASSGHCWACSPAWINDANARLTGDVLGVPASVILAIWSVIVLILLRRRA